VQLCYRIDRSAYTGTNDYPEANDADFAVAAMSDEGTYGDGAAGDGVYGAQIPPLADGTIIEFYVLAVDGGGRVRTWPAPSLVDGAWQQVTNALYQVDSSFDPNWTPGRQPIYYLIMTEMERGRLAYIGTHSTTSGPDSQMNATFISLDGTGMELRYNVGCAAAGTARRAAHNSAYRIPSVPLEGPLRSPLQLHHSGQIMGSAFAWRLPQAAPVQLRINGANLATAGGPMYGVYAQIDAFNSFFAERYFPSDPNGNLYACFRDNGEADFRYLGSDPGPYRPSYFKESNAAADD
jgi:hypothetical protein